MGVENKPRGFFGRTWKAMLMALVLALASFLVSANFVSDWPWAEFVDTTGTRHFFHILLQEAAVAVLIAIVIKEMIESDYERRHQLAMVQGAAASRAAVLRALFGTFFDEATIEEVYRSIFSSTLIREDMAVTYRLRKHARSEWLVHLEVEMAYVVRNSATTTAHFHAETAAANYAAIFRKDGGLSPPVLKFARIGDKEFSPTEIEALNKAVRRDDSPVTFTFGGFPIKAGGSLIVKIVYEREKLICDSELMRMSYPTKKVILNIDNGCAPELEVQVREIGQQGFTPRPEADPAATQWHCVNEGILLQNNGWVLFWNDTHLRPTEIAGPRRSAQKA